MHLRKWKTLAPLGLATVGFGVSLVGDAIVRKSHHQPWFVAGTVGLVVLNAGLCLFGDAVKHRALHEAQHKHPDDT